MTDDTITDEELLDVLHQDGFNDKEAHELVNPREGIAFRDLPIGTLFEDYAGNKLMKTTPVIDRIRRISVNCVCVVSDSHVAGEMLYAEPNEICYPTPATDLEDK